MGTGDGRYVLTTAAPRPDRLLIGVDADAAAMTEVARRAAAKPNQGGLPKALFVAGVTRIIRRGAGPSLLLGLGAQPIRDDTMAVLRHAYRNWDLAVTEVRLATAADVEAAHSSWAKRLSAGRNRPAWLLPTTWRSARFRSSAATVSQSEYLSGRVGR